jgi:hypothetical protein
MAAYCSAAKDASFDGLTTTSTSVLARNPGRQYLHIQNISAVSVWINFGAAAAASTQGSLLLVSGASLIFGEGDGAFVPSDEVFAKSDSATADLTIKHA